MKNLLYTFLMAWLFVMKMLVVVVAVIALLVALCYGASHLLGAVGLSVMLVFLLTLLMATAVVVDTHMNGELK